MQIRLAILLCSIIAIAHAQDNCPWMNAGTGGGFLGGDVTAKFWSDGKQGGKCEFTRPTMSDAILRIEVTIMASPKTQFAQYLGKCGANAKPVKAIGNEAFACSSGHEQRIVGRVRDQAFVLTMTSADKKESVEKAAEIVAGNLF